MSWIVRYPALFNGTWGVAAIAAFMVLVTRQPYPVNLVWVAVITVPAAWLNWLAVTLLLQRTGWRAPLWSEKFSEQVMLANFWSYALALLLGLMASTLEIHGVRHHYVPVFLAGCIPPAVIQYLISRKALLVRGRLVRPQWEADLDLYWLRPDDDEGLAWGGLKAPTRTATLHYVVVGATGSGKSLLIQLLKQGAIKSVARAMVLNAKGDEVSKLAGLVPMSRVKILHFRDARGAGWHMAADCTTVPVALAIAVVLAGDEDEGPNSYFTKAARHILSGILIALLRTAPGVWTFRDVLVIAQDKDLIVQVLGLVAETRDRLEHLKEERAAQSVLSTLITKLAEFGPIAAAWDNATERVSLKEWAEVGGSILVLGNDEEARAPIDAINRVLFRRASELVLARPETPHPDTWFILDEVREAGRLDGLGGLLTKGRSKGAAVVLGFQDIEGMRAVYGDKEANELVGQCAHKALLRLESPATAEWAAQVVGQSEWVEEKVTDSGGGRSVTYERVKREGVLPSEFQSLPPTNPWNGLSGVFIAPEAGAFRATITGKELAKSLRLCLTDQTPARTSTRR
jgi:hypothetical protein